MAVESQKSSYVPNKARSRPLRCIILPIVGTFLFILYWFVLCPLVYIGLCKMPLQWTYLWHFYYWITCFIIFLIIFIIIVLLWRTKCHSCAHKEEKQNQDMDTEMQTIPFDQEIEQKVLLSNLSASEHKKDADGKRYINGDMRIKQDQRDDNLEFEDEIIRTDLEEKKEPDQITTKQGDAYICAEHRKLDGEGGKITSGKTGKPENLILPAEETSVQLHSPAYPLTPREIFFWDLIQGANKSDSINLNQEDTCDDFKGDESVDSSKGSRHGLSSLEGGDDSDSKSGIKEGDTCIAKTSKNMDPSSADHDERRRHYILPVGVPGSPDTEYFIANVPKRRTLSNEVYLYIDAGDDDKYLRIRTGEELEPINI